MKNNILLYTLLTIFLVIGFIAPHFSSAFNTNIGSVNTDGVISSAENSEVGVTQVFLSLVTVFFWTFGNLPTWLDALILVPLRLLFYIVLYDKIRGI